jgi:ABC-type amino acid transport substrate-binding protein
LPSHFFNLDGELVGFDTELAKNLADSFGVRVEFNPTSYRSPNGGHEPRRLAH